MSFENKIFFLPRKTQYCIREENWEQCHAVLEIFRQSPNSVLPFLQERVVIAKWLLCQLLCFLASITSRWVHEAFDCEDIRRIYLCHFQPKFLKKRMYFFFTFFLTHFLDGRKQLQCCGRWRWRRHKIGAWVYVPLHKIEPPRDKEESDLYT